MHPAPGPEEVNWSALWMSYKDREFRGWFVKPMLAILILIPIGMFSGIFEFNLNLNLNPCTNQTVSEGIDTGTF